MQPSKTACSRNYGKQLPSKPQPRSVARKKPRSCLHRHHKHPTRHRHKCRTDLPSMHFSLGKEEKLMTSSPISSSPTDPWQKLTGLCDPLVLHAPNTWADLSYASRMEMPQGLDATVSYIRNNLVGRLWRNHLILLTAVLYSQNFQY